MTKTSLVAQHTLLRFETPFRPVDGGGRAESNTALPKTGMFAIRDTTTYTNGFKLLGTAIYGDNMDGAEGELFLIDIMPKHPQSTTPYDKTTAFLQGDDLRVHQVKSGDKFQLIVASGSFTKGVQVVTSNVGGVQLTGDGTAANKNGWRFIVLATTSSKTYVDLECIGIGSVDVTS